MFNPVRVTGLLLLVLTFHCSGAPLETAELGATISGAVTDENSVALANVDVSQGTVTAQTDAKGQFSLLTTAAGNSGFVAIHGVKEGYAHVARRVPVTGGLAFVRLVMRKADVVTSFTMPDVNTTVNLGVAHGDVSSVITLHGGTLQTASGAHVVGEVKATLTMWSPNELLDSSAGVLRAALPDGSPGDDAPRVLRTYGMVDILLQQNGEDLQIIPGQTALLDIVTNINMREGFATRAPALASPSLWTLDPNSGLWVEDIGDGVYDPNTGTLHATLRHLSTKNSDEPITPSNNEAGCIRGKVVDLCNKPVVGASVTMLLQSGLFYGTTIPVSATTDNTGTYAMNVNPATHMGYYGYATYKGPDGQLYTTNTINSMQQGFLPATVEPTTVPGDVPEYELIPMAVLLCSTPSGQCVDGACRCYDNVNDPTCLSSIGIPGGADGRNPCWRNPMGRDIYGAQCYPQYNMYKSWTGVATGSLCQNCWPLVTLQLPYKQTPTCTGVGGANPQTDPCQAAAASSIRGIGDVCSITGGDVCCPSVGSNATTCADNLCVPAYDPPYSE